MAHTPDPTRVCVTCGQPVDGAAEMLAALKLGVAARGAQRLYFKTREQSALIASKEAEKTFDAAARAAIAKAEGG